MGNYTLGEMIGKGGMGTVYRAHHEGLDIDVAVKFIHEHLAHDDEIVERFLREARLAAKVKHPNVVQVYDTGRDETGRPYIVMELLDGESLRQRLKRGAIPEEDAVQIVKQVLEGLDEAHEQEVVHRDIKPGNIFITARGRAKIVDFGIAKGLGSSRLTGTGTQIGTPEYMSPEQAEGKPVDGRTDLYSLGIVLYEMLTGTVPFSADSGIAVLRMHLDSPPPPLPATTPKWLRDVAERALAKSPSDRFASASAMLAVLKPSSAGRGRPARLQRAEPTSQTLAAGESRVEKRADGNPGRLSRRWLVLVPSFVLGGVVLSWVANLPGRAVKPDGARPINESSIGPGTALSENALAVRGSAKLSAKGDMELVYVPAGAFTMGSENGYPCEKPVRKVFMDAYWIGKTEVTVAQFRVYCESTSYSYDWRANKPAWGWVDNHPMVNVTWDEARAFSKWAGGDLPTEAQWEKAARGSDGRVYPWGNKWDASRYANNLESTEPVGSYPSGASPYGCLDMAGNVWEWCRDWYAEAYDPGETRNPTGASSGSGRVLRGGSWETPLRRLDLGWYFRSSYRNWGYPVIGINCYGFRISSGP